ncbi:MAG: type II toxin-antitoxin system HigB family toxin [Spirochaetaceae bacterium]
MIIETEAKLRRIVNKYPTARESINGWIKNISNIHPKHIIELRESIRHADAVGYKNMYTCFNICGGTYRLITAIDYRRQSILIVEFLLHKDYDRKYVQRKGK